MTIRTLIAFAGLAALTACAAAGDVGDECSADEDCAEDLECHFHDGEEDHGECEEHHDDEEEE